MVLIKSLYSLISAYVCLDRDDPRDVALLPVKL